MAGSKSEGLHQVLSRARFESGEVHVWRMQFASAELAEQAWPLMNDQERARADSFRFTRDRERFCKSRLLVRSVLSRYLDLDPAKVAIVPGPHGKPLIDDPSGDHGLQFNLAHCQTTALLAVTARQPVGIDVEDDAGVRTADIGALAQEFLTEREARTIQALAGADRIRAFLLCWTRKEALLKAVGVGLTEQLDGFEVPLDGAGSWRVTWAPQDSCKTSTFDMADLTEGDMVAAVAAWRIVNRIVISDF
jgi:4'-phosphopantetheinyl transferase